MSKPTIFISPELVSNYKQRLNQETSEATAKRKMSSLNRFFDWAQSQGHIDENPLISKDQSQVIVTQDTSSLINLKNFFRFGIITAMVILAFLLLRKLRFPIPFLPAPAEEVAVISTPFPQGTPAAEKPIDTQAIIASIKEEVTKLVESSLEWASFVDGNLLIGEDSVEQITLATADTSDGDINLNPDGSGNLNLILEGNSGNQVSALSANLTNGSLYYGSISNNANSPYLIKLDSGSTADTKFSVRADGYTTIDGSLNLAGDLQFSGLTRITQAGKLEFLTGYSQNGGKFEIEQGVGDFVGITKDLSGPEGPATKDAATITLQEVSPSNYDTLVLNRIGGTNDALALFVDNGNARFDGQLQLGNFSANPTAIGEGSIVYNTTNDQLYFNTASGWTQVGSGSNADTLDSLDSTQFLRSDTSDNYTSGTLAFNAGTTLDVNGDLIITDTNIAFDGASTTFTNTGNMSFSDGTYTLAAIKDQGIYPFWNLAGKADTGNPVTCAEGDIYYNAFDDTISICHTGNVWEQLDGGAGSVSLDTAYNTGGAITVDAYDVLFNLNDLTNDYKFTIDNTTAGDIATALAVTTTAASGTFGTAIDVSDADIVNAVSAGKEVTVSKTDVTFNGWTGCGYIILEPNTGAGAYLISGNKSGAFILFNGPSTPLFFVVSYGFDFVSSIPGGIELAVAGYLLSEADLEIAKKCDATPANCAHYDIQAVYDVCIAMGSGQWANIARYGLRKDFLQQGYSAEWLGKSHAKWLLYSALITLGVYER